MKTAYGPGSGWQQVSPKTPPVWDHESGVRIHYGCPLIRWADGTAPAVRWPDCQEIDRYIRINGGNRKRGVMAYARAMAEKGGGE